MAAARQCAPTPKKPQTANHRGTVALPTAREELAIHIIRSLQSCGYLAYLVGGCVRDRLLGLSPKDFDVVTDARPEQIARIFPNSSQIGAHFGVILVKSDAGAAVEVATFRTEGDYSDGRRPDAVQFEKDPAADARRRDFTVNALMQDPLSGKVYDFVDGRRDLQDRVIRAIGDPHRRFEEDYLRMLRAVRFAARLRFSIEPSTLAAIRKNAGNVSKISAERIREELTRMLTEGGASEAFSLLDQSELLAYLLPEVKAFQGVEQPPEYHPEGDVWTHVLLMLGMLQGTSVSLALGVLLHDVGKPATFEIADRIRFNGHAEVGAEMVPSILSRFRFSNEVTDQVTSLVANHMRFKDVRQMRVSTLKRFLSLADFDEHLELHRLDCLASNGFTDSLNFIIEKRAEFGQEKLLPKRLITGNDLIQAGYRPGPIFRLALEEVETAQLEGSVTTRDDALQLAKRILNDAA
jgi:putative nucleotidyltransferase with HDIG domain